MILTLRNCPCDLNFGPFDVQVKIKLFANHRGLLTFAICPNNNMTTSPSRNFCHFQPKHHFLSRNCFLKHHLMVDGGKLFSVHTGDKFENVHIQLPEDMTCSQCILQVFIPDGPKALLDVLISCWKAHTCICTR